MSIDVEDLRFKANSYSNAVANLGVARQERDEAKRLLKDKEVEIFAEKIALGVIDGKNAETREAQAQLQYRSNPQWQALSIRYRTAEDSFLNAQDQVTVALTNLKVAAIIVNAKIAESGAGRLLAEVALAGA